MFTGLIEHVGTVGSFERNADGGAQLGVDVGPLAEGTRLGDSIAIDGCCLTVVALDGSRASFDAVPETLRRTTLGDLSAGSRVNLERALLPSKRFGGHFVQGHVDGTAIVRKTVTGGRWAEWHFSLDSLTMATQIVEKGSIAIDGISLTVAGCDGVGGFWVALIPETLARTTIGAKYHEARVNIETDILGKYVHAMLQAKTQDAKPRISEEWLRDHGY